MAADGTLQTLSGHAADYDGERWIDAEGPASRRALALLLNPDRRRVERGRGERDQRTVPRVVRS